MAALGRQIERTAVRAAQPENHSLDQRYPCQEYGVARRLEEVQMKTSPTLNCATVRIIAATLPADGPVEQRFNFCNNELPIVVNGRWRIPPGQSGTFISYRMGWPFNSKLRWKRVE